MIQDPEHTLHDELTSLNRQFISVLKTAAWGDPAEAALRFGVPVDHVMLIRAADAFALEALCQSGKSLLRLRLGTVELHRLQDAVSMGLHDAG